MNRAEAHEELRNAYAAFLLEVGSLHPENHALWRYLQQRVNDIPLVPMAAIAEELGLDVDALVRWMLAYKGPKRKAYMRKTEPALIAHSVAEDSNARRFAAWRRATNAAHKARMA